DGAVGQLKALGLTSEIIAWRLRLFVPAAEDRGPPILAAIFEPHPLLGAGDVMNTPGRSLYVRLQGPASGPGAAGKWTDAATGEHGDLLDLIGRNRDLHRLGEAMDEARFFLALPRPPAHTARAAPAPSGSPEAARRLFRSGRPVPGTPAEAYLRA